MEIEFTNHAKEKFEILERHGFKVSIETVVETLRNPDRIEKVEESLNSSESHRQGTFIKSRV